MLAEQGMKTKDDFRVDDDGRSELHLAAGAGTNIT